MTAYEMRISDWSSDVCSSDLDRQRFELVEGRRAGQGPFQRGGAFAPGIALRLLARGQRPDEVDEEDQHAGGHDLIAVAGKLVPIGERLRIVGIAARHADRKSVG